MRLGGVGIISGCSFLSNFVSTRGHAIAAVVESVNISRSSFDGNSVYCASGSYRGYAEEVKGNGRRNPSLDQESVLQFSAPVITVAHTEL